MRRSQSPKLLVRRGPHDNPEPRAPTRLVPPRSAHTVPPVVCRAGVPRVPLADLRRQHADQDRPLHRYRHRVCLCDTRIYVGTNVKCYKPRAHQERCGRRSPRRQPRIRLPCSLPGARLRLLHWQVGSWGQQQLLLW